MCTWTTYECCGCGRQWHSIACRCALCPAGIGRHDNRFPEKWQLAGPLQCRRGIWYDCPGGERTMPAHHRAECRDCKALREVFAWAENDEREMSRITPARCWRRLARSAGWVAEKCALDGVARACGRDVNDWGEPRRGFRYHAARLRCIAASSRD